MNTSTMVERSPLGYEYRIFPAAQPYTFTPGALVFINLRSDKNSGLARVKPEQEAALATPEQGEGCKAQQAPGGNSPKRKNEA